MPTIFAIDGADFADFADFGAVSSSVASLQTALVALGRGVGDTTLAKIVVDGLIGPKTTAATNRAFTVHIGSYQAPAQYRTGALTQSEVAANALDLASLVGAEAQRRGYNVPTSVVIKAVAQATAPKTTAMVSYTPPATPAVTTTYVPQSIPAPSSDDSRATIIKWSAIGLGLVVVSAGIYYFVKRRGGTMAGCDFGAAEFDVDKIKEQAAELLHWSVRDVNSVSLSMLRELVRDKSPKLAHEISLLLTSGGHIYRRGLGDDGDRYKTFIRSATGWDSFSRARKRTVDTGLTYDEAQRACKRFNDSRSSSQIRKGTKMEFTRQ